MRRYSKMGLAALAGSLALGSVVPAAADGASLSLGAGFTVGGASVHVDYASPQYGHAPYYYRSSVLVPGYALVEHRVYSHRYQGHRYQGYPYAGTGYHPVGPPRYHGQGHTRDYRPRYESYGHRGRGHGYGSSERHGDSKRGYGRSHGRKNGHVSGGGARVRPRRH